MFSRECAAPQKRIEDRSIHRRSNGWSRARASGREARIFTIFWSRLQPLANPCISEVAQAETAWNLFEL